MTKKKTKKKELSNKSKNLLTFTILILAMCITIIYLELLMSLYSNEYDEQLINSYSRLNLTNKEIINLTNLNFISVALLDEPSELGSACKSGCNLDINEYDVNYKYIIKRIERGEYVLSVINEEHYVLKDYSLGTNIDTLYLIKYDGNVLLYNQKSMGESFYDNAVIINAKENIDEISSVENNEMLLTEEGIIYYYDRCEASSNANAMKVKAMRKPFEKKADIIEEYYVNYSWCNN